MISRPFSLTHKIFIGLLFGGIFGYLLLYIAKTNEAAELLINTYLLSTFSIAKMLFMNSLKMLVVPLVFVSIICGTCSLSQPNQLGSLASKSLLLYLFSTAAAISLALFLANLFDLKPETLMDTTYVQTKGTSLTDVLGNLIPSNPIKSMASGNMLQIIIFSLLLGFSISQAGEKGKVIASFFQSFNEVLLKLVTIVMHIAPYGVFFIVSMVLYETGPDKIKKVLVYFLLVAGALILHLTCVYSLMLIVLARLNPLILFKKLRPAMLLAFSTASSAATLPVTMDIARKRLGIGKTTASFTLPMGATINMDGTAIMQGVATVFIAQLAGADLSIVQYLTIILMATLASIGTAGVPGVGMITLTMVLTQVNLPIEAIAMLLTVDRLLDMMRTAVNITGDATVALIVSKKENDLCIKTFNNPNA
jgi:Na+/H+-dicarboxylate symporter